MAPLLPSLPYLQHIFDGWEGQARGTALSPVVFGEAAGMFLRLPSPISESVAQHGPMGFSAVRGNRIGHLPIQAHNSTTYLVVTGQLEIYCRPLKGLPHLPMYRGYD